MTSRKSPYSERLDDVTKLFDSLEGLDAVDASSAQGRPLEIALDQIEEDPDQPRQTFDPAALDELAASIKARGVVQAIVVTPRSAGEGGKHRLVMGARRLRAARLAGLNTIPAFVREPTGEDAYDQMVENLQRDDLKPLEIAAFIAARLAAKEKPSQIAQRLGKSPAFVTMHASVADMPELLRTRLDRSPIRAVYELHQAWKQNGGAVEAYVAAHDPITRADATAFVHSLRSTPEPDAAPRRGRPAGPPRREQPPAPVSPGPAEAKAASSPVQREGMEPRDGTVPSPSTARAQAGADDAAGRSAVTLKVEHAGRKGRLRLDRHAEAGSRFGIVEFGRGRFEELPVADLTLTEIVSA